MKLLVLLLCVQLCTLATASVFSLRNFSEEEKLTNALLSCFKWFDSGLSSGLPSMMERGILPMGEEWKTILEVNNTSGKKDVELCYQEKTGAWMVMEDGSEKAPDTQRSAPGLSLTPQKPQISLLVAPRSEVRSAKVGLGLRVVIQQYTISCGDFNLKTTNFKRTEWDEYGNRTVLSITGGSSSADFEGDGSGRGTRRILSCKSGWV